MRIFVVTLIILHGLIHLMGFFKAFGLAELKALTLPISKMGGVVWLLVAILILATAILYMARGEDWFWLGLIVSVLSQILIFSFWTDAKYGSIINILIFIVALQALAAWSFERTYRRDVGALRAIKSEIKEKVVTPADLQHLPTSVRKYLNYVGVVDQSGLHNFQVKMKGKMRGKDEDWFAFDAQQFTSIIQPSRLFFMNARVKGLPTAGYHDFRDGEAKMQIKLLSTFSVAKHDGPIMNQSETVTFFNDLCIMAPAALVNPNIRWEEIGTHSARAHFTLNDISISALLEFNEIGQLINFISEDRYEINDQKKYRFSTPLSNYREFNGYRLASYGEANWEFPDGNFTYGQFEITAIDYNID